MDANYTFSFLPLPPAQVSKLAQERLTPTRERSERAQYEAYAQSIKHNATQIVDAIETKLETIPQGNTLIINIRRATRKK